MSNYLAIAAVTATLRNMLFQAVSDDPGLAGTIVTTKAPDQARTGTATGNQLNLFLYRTSIDAAWRNQDPPTIRPGELAQPPLPLVLSYLLTAYGEDDDELLAHRLLGAGMQVLNDQPMLSPTAVAKALSGSGLEDQPDLVKITPHSIPMDEISRLWATFSTGYRISASYDASVVLIDNSQPVLAPLPVLARAAGDTGPFASARLAPIVQAVVPPDKQPGARPGDTVTVTGQYLAGTAGVQLAGGALSEPRPLPATLQSDGSLSFVLPTSADTPLPAGIVAVTVQATTDQGDILASNSAPLALVPVLTNTDPITATLVNGEATIEVPCAPPVIATQVVELVVGQQVITGTPAAAGSQPRTSLSFTLQGLAAGEYVLRLRVDGQDSIPVLAGETTFDHRQSLVLS